MVTSTFTVKRPCDCFSTADIEPVLSILYKTERPPMMFKNGSPKVRVNGTWIQAFKLPVITNVEELSKSNGWYEYEDENTDPIYHFDMIDCPKIPAVTQWDGIHLLIHQDCVSLHPHPIYQYDETEDRMTFSSRGGLAPCIVCRQPACDRSNPCVIC